MALSASEERRKFKTRDLRPTRITLKALNRCVGARRLAQLCEVGEWGVVLKDPLKMMLGVNCLARDFKK